MPIFRSGEPRDLAAAAAIQQASPEAAEWDAAEYMAHQFLVAEVEGRVVGFLAGRAIDDSEAELLNLAVAPDFRRKGIARALVQAFARTQKGAIFLEVRESNQAARNLYKSLGFQEVGVRSRYYERCPESAIVMKLHSC
jgi:[ribosomal protein S18]-alanine N-acetyltransferase